MMRQMTPSGVSLRYVREVVDSTQAFVRDWVQYGLAHLVGHGSLAMMPIETGGDVSHGTDATRDLAEELNLLIDGAAGYAIYMLDTDGRVTIWNKGAERLKGWAEQEVLGQHTSIFYPPDAI